MPDLRDEPPLQIGIEASADPADLHHLPDGKAEPSGDDKKGWRDLLAWIGRVPFAGAIHDATGAWHRQFAPHAQ